MHLDHLDDASWVKWWNSEETVIGYICATDNKPHRYLLTSLYELQVVVHS